MKTIAEESQGWIEMPDDTDERERIRKLAGMIWRDALAYKRAHPGELEARTAARRAREAASAKDQMAGAG